MQFLAKLLNKLPKEWFAEKTGKPRFYLKKFDWIALPFVVGSFAACICVWYPSNAARIGLSLAVLAAYILHAGWWNYDWMRVKEKGRLEAEEWARNFEQAKKQG